MSDDEKEEVTDLSDPGVTTKYRTSGDITQKALAAVCEACVDGADIGELCAMGDKILEEEAGKLYNKKEKGKKIEKGVAFPTCISVNDVVAHFCPCLDATKYTLKAGDVAKVELACHIDGFITCAGHTVIVGGEPVDDRRADVIMAAWQAAEAAIRLVQPGAKNTAVTDAFQKIAADFNCKPVQGVVSHQVKKHVIDGSRVIIGAPCEGEKFEEFEFEMNEVYCMDVVMSTGEGKPKESDFKSTVYKRAVEKSYNLKTQKARQFISEVNRRFPALPFTLRAIEDEQVARVGISEARRHELLEEYPVFREKEGHVVAQLKFMLLLLPGGTKKITGLPLPDKGVTSSLSVQDEDMKKLLAKSANPRKKKSSKKKDDEEAEAKEG